MSDELLPCPFCGAPAYVLRERDVMDEAEIKRLKPHSWVDCSDHCQRSCKDGDEAMVVAAWNRRTNVDR